MSKALLAGFVIFFLQYDFTFVCIYEVCRLESLIANIVTCIKQNFKQKLSLTLSHSLLYYGKSKCDPNMREICIYLLIFFASLFCGTKQFKQVKKTWRCASLLLV